MLQSLSHAVIYVLDQDRAKRFYTEVLGLEVRVDLTTDGLRWLTVGAPDDPDHELVLTLAEPIEAEPDAEPAAAGGVSVGGDA